MVLTIGRSEVECETFRVKGSYSSTIARLFSLPVAVESREPLTLEVTIKGNKFRPYKASRRVYWNKKLVGYFVLSNVSQEWDSDKYRTRLELKQCERSSIPDEEVPAYKWRFDLQALAEGLPETDGAKVAAGRAIDPFANSWKAGSSEVASDADDGTSPAVLPVSQGGTGADKPELAIINLGGIPIASKGIPFGVAPLGADGKVSALYLPPGGGGGGGDVVFPITVAQGGTGALDAATARDNLGAVGFSVLANYVAIDDITELVPPLVAGVVPIAFLPPYPTLGSLGAASASAVASALSLKLDASARSAVNGVAPLGSDTKVPIAFLPAYPTLDSLAAASDAELAAAVALLIPNTAKNAANGVAGLDGSSLISAAQIPLSIQFQYIGIGTAFNFNTWSLGSAAMRWVDSSVTNTNFPAFSANGNGTLFQFDPLFGLGGSSNKYKFHTFVNHTTERVADRQQINGTWGTWYERAYLNKAQSFLNLQEFAAAATFKGGGIPAITNTMVQAGVDAGGQPRLWIVNAAAAAGNRLKSITIAANGNIQIRHHADDGTDGNVLEHTASGNILTNGTVRPGSGATAFTGASFVSGATYYRTDLLGDSGVGCATYSDGSVWRRVGDGTLTTEAARFKKIITGTTAATQGATVNVAHGVPGGLKVTSLTGVIFYAAGQVVPINSRQANYASIVSTNTTDFSITNETGNSSAILSKPFSVTIEYTS